MGTRACAGIGEVTCELAGKVGDTRECAEKGAAACTCAGGGKGAGEARVGRGGLGDVAREDTSCCGDPLIFFLVLLR